MLHITDVSLKLSRLSEVACGIALAVAIGCGPTAAQVASPAIEEAGKAAGMALVCSRGHPADLRAAEKGAARVQSVALKQGGAVAEAIAQASIQVGTLYAQSNPDQCTNVRTWFERAMKALDSKITHS